MTTAKKSSVLFNFMNKGERVLEFDESFQYNGNPASDEVVETRWKRRSETGATLCARSVMLKGKKAKTNCGVQHWFNRVVVAAL